MNASIFAALVQSVGTRIFFLRKPKLRYDGLSKIVPFFNSSTGDTDSIQDTASVRTLPENVPGWSYAVGIGLAILYLLWWLWIADPTHTYDQDAARHAMNGAVVYDALRTGGWQHPVEFVTRYYSHFPALSMPYHPPLFPALESFFYLLFGVSARAAHIAVETCAAISVFLLYLLTYKAFRSVLLGCAVTMVFCALPVSRLVATDVWLEFPALMFVLGALLFVDNIQAWTGFAPAIGFALLASAAVWTKQMVFLGLVPWLLVAWRREWRVLARPPIWIASVIFGASCVALYALTRLAKFSGAHSGWRQRSLMETVTGNIIYYTRVLYDQLGLVAVLLTLVGIAYVFLDRYREGRERTTTQLCLVWAFAGVIVPLFIGGYNERYIFYVFPALLLLGFSAAYVTAASRIGRGKAGVAVMVIALAICATKIVTNRIVHQGPRDAVAYALRSGPVRILYLGKWPGQVIMATRELDSSLQSVVIRGDKLAASEFAPESLAKFAKTYGVQFVVAQFDDKSKAHSYDWLRTPHTAPFEQKYNARLRTTLDGVQGEMFVFRYTGPAGSQRDDMKVRSGITGQQVELTF